MTPYNPIIARSDARTPKNPESSAISRSRPSVFSMSVWKIYIFQTDIENTLGRERLMALLSGFFGVLASLLAMVGLYGVMSYIVAMRKNEIGIRMALGASRGNVIGIVVG